MTDRRSVWAWGMESREPAPAQFAAAARKISAGHGVSLGPASPPSPDAISLRSPRFKVPDSLAIAQHGR